MRSRDEIIAKIEELENDERLPQKHGGKNPKAYAIATVFANAPLALIQMDMGSQLRALRWTLGGM